MAFSSIQYVRENIFTLPGDVHHTISGWSWLTRLSLGLFTTAVITWTMFQKKMLPKPVAKVVSKVFFLPTFPITIMMRIGNYWTRVDDTLFLGCAPMAVMSHPDQMYKLGVRGVVNMCYEYGGPIAAYERLGMKQLHLPTVDHIEPSLEFLERGVAFIQEHHERGEKVYVHCKAAHGRGASIALAWMVKQNPNKSAEVRYEDAMRTHCFRRCVTYCGVV
mmetsp:Transcript_4206/g.6698  ORF Transcript_4206/g.6698 Transcript_4206/m.6698 type:complete len:219 (+) Transcript_4206:69-725(+)